MIESVYRCKQQQTTDRKQTRWVWPAADLQSLIFDLKLHAMCITDQLPFRPSPETTAQSTTRPFQNKSRNFILRQSKRFFLLNKNSWSVIKDLTPLCGVHHVQETQAFLFRKASVTMVTDCAPYLEKMTEWNFSDSVNHKTPSYDRVWKQYMECGDNTLLSPQQSDQSLSDTSSILVHAQGCNHR